MHTHNPSCLEGPFTGTRQWWHIVDDNAEISSNAKKEPLFRAALVEKIRREIAAGTYETPEKWEKALDRLLRRIEGLET
jgi:anti-sigma28 factor (negative regulator of flagellin synthesis)